MSRRRSTFAEHGTPDEDGTGITAPFNAPGLGPPPWFVYRITPTEATAVTQKGGSTRWTF